MTQPYPTSPNDPRSPKPGHSPGEQPIHAPIPEEPIHRPIPEITPPVPEPAPDPGRPAPPEPGVQTTPHLPFGPIG